MESAGTIAVWVTFTVDVCSSITIDYCDSPATPTSVYIVLHSGCPCATSIANTAIDWDGCPGAEGHPAITWKSMQPDTYAYPVYSDPLDAAIGPYTLTVNGVAGQTPPPNDDCAFAPTIVGAGAWPFDTTCCTRNPMHPLASSPDCVDSTEGDTAPDADIWFLWEATTEVSGTVCVSLCEGTAYDAVLAVYDTTDCALVSLGNEIACNDDSCATSGGPSEVELTGVLSDASYLIRVGGWNNAGGPGILTITAGRCSELPILGADDCADAEPILCGDAWLVDLDDKTSDPTDPNIVCYYEPPSPANNTAWFLFTATEDSVEIQTCNSPDPETLDTLAVLWPMAVCGEFIPCSEIACSEDACGPDDYTWLSKFCATVTPGETYYVEIASFAGGGNAWPALIEVTCPCP